MKTSPGAMQHYALTVDKFLEHAAKWHGDVAVVSADVNGAPVRRGYAEIRQRAMDGLGFLGIAADPAANAADDGDREIGAPAAAARSLVITAREDIEIARQVRAALAR